MTKTIKVAAAQFSPFFLDKKKTIDKACSAIWEAGEQAADQLCKDGCIQLFSKKLRRSMM